MTLRFVVLSLLCVACGGVSGVDAGTSAGGAAGGFAVGGNGVGGGAGGGGVTGGGVAGGSTAGGSAGGSVVAPPDGGATNRFTARTVIAVKDSFDGGVLTELQVLLLDRALPNGCSATVSNGPADLLRVRVFNLRNGLSAGTHGVLPMGEDPRQAPYSTVQLQQLDALNTSTSSLAIGGAVFLDSLSASRMQGRLNVTLRAPDGGLSSASAAWDVPFCP
jgi:hypothetical protein